MKSVLNTLILSILQLFSEHTKNILDLNKNYIFINLSKISYKKIHYIVHFPLFICNLYCFIFFIICSMLTSKNWIISTKSNTQM